MKKILVFIIIALFALTTCNSNSNSNEYVDFDDDVYVEIVKI
ncbi:MAG: hypothetical protein ACVCEJ_00365 [Candidatus Izemoplasmataceae bacterium]